MRAFIEKWISVYEYMLVNSYLVFYVNLLNATQFMLGKRVTASPSKWDSNLRNILSRSSFRLLELLSLSDYTDV